MPTAGTSGTHARLLWQRSPHVIPGASLDGDTIYLLDNSLVSVLLLTPCIVASHLNASHRELALTELVSADDGLRRSFVFRKIMADLPDCTMVGPFNFAGQQL